MLEIRENKMYVQLSSTLDVERFLQKSSNEKFEELLKPNGTLFIRVSSYKQAIELCREFISYFNLGSSNWLGGLIVDDNYNFLARVSYNGRLWDNTDDNWKIANEIVL